MKKNKPQIKRYGNKWGMTWRGMTMYYTFWQSALRAALFISKTYEKTEK